jgi:hypothetical protein
MVKRAFTVIIVYSRFTVFYSEKTVKIEVFVVKLHQFNGLIIRGSQDHALVGPQPKGNIIKGLCCQRRRPFLFGVNLCQVCARFCDFRGKTGVNGGERSGIANIILFSTIILKSHGSTSPTPSYTQEEMVRIHY